MPAEAQEQPLGFASGVTSARIAPLKPEHDATDIGVAAVSVSPDADVHHREDSPRSREKVQELPPVVDHPTTAETNTPAQAAHHAPRTPEPHEESEGATHVTTQQPDDLQVEDLERVSDEETHSSDLSEESQGEAGAVVPQVVDTAADGKQQRHRQTTGESGRRQRLERQTEAHPRPIAQGWASEGPRRGLGVGAWLKEKSIDAGWQIDWRVGTVDDNDSVSESEEEADKEPDQSLDGLMFLVPYPRMLKALLCCCTRSQLRSLVGARLGRFVRDGQVIIENPVPGQTQKDYEQLGRLEINDDAVNALFDVFDRMDIDKSGEISIDEFHEFFRLRATPWSQRVFTMLDMNASGEVDFKEFVLSVWDYCTVNKNSLATFAFSLFDVNESGFLERSELAQLVSAVYGDSAHAEERLDRIMGQLDADGDGAVSRLEFVMYNSTQPLLLFPAYQFQATLRQRVLGESWWNQMAEEREKRFRTKNLIEILNDMKEDPDTKRRLMHKDLSKPAHAEDLDMHPLRFVQSQTAGSHDA